MFLFSIEMKIGLVFQFHIQDRFGYKHKKKEVVEILVLALILEKMSPVADFPVSNKLLFLRTVLIGQLLIRR